MKRIFVAVFVLFFVSGNSFLIAQNNPVFPNGFSSQYVQNFTYTFPVGLAFNEDGTKMFVWERRGRVYISNFDTATHSYNIQTTPVLDISDEVGNWNDHGFLGFAPDPNFNTNGLIYCMYVVDQHFLLNPPPNSSYDPNANAYLKATIGRITRYRLNTTGGNLVADPGSRKILLGETKETGIPVLFRSHGVGTLLFGTDGTLLASTGDGASYFGTDTGPVIDASGINTGSYAQEALDLGIITASENVGAFRAQKINSLDGKILRLDPATGDGVPGNPFYITADPRTPRSRVWALGFRNPFRFTIKPNTGSSSPASANPGTLFISDVGLSQWEKISVCDQPGQNFGWPKYEGISPLPAFSSQKTFDLEQPNPIGNCDPNQPQAYFQFNDLLRDPTADGSKTMYNPCDPNTIIDPDGNPNRYIHKEPLLDYTHPANTQARVPIFSGNNISIANIGTPESGTSGSLFNGFCALAGTFWTGNKYPSAYNGTFFFSDFSQWIRNVKLRGDNTLAEINLFGSVSDNRSQSLNVFCMKQNPMDGLIYYINYKDPTISDALNGMVRKISYDDLPPVANISITNNSGKNHGNSPLKIDFSSSESTDPDGTITGYKWDFGNGDTSTLPDASHTFIFQGPHTFSVSLMVTDDAGKSNKQSMDILVNDQNTGPVVIITNPVAGETYSAGNSITLRVNATDSNGKIKKVEFYNDGNKFGEDSVAPYEITGINVEAGYYSLTAKATDSGGAITVSDTVRITVSACLGSGSLFGEGFTNIPGTGLISLSSSPNYPGNPAVSTQVNKFEYGPGIADNYGGRLRGYICAPITGNYTFYIASADQSELWLSTDDNPFNIRRISYTESKVPFRTWNINLTQKSISIQLVKGARYYVESIHKAGSGEDYLSVAWTLPNGAFEAPIPGNRLSPWQTSSSGGGLSFDEAMKATQEPAATVMELTVIATPNPTQNNFILNTKSNSDTRLTIIVRDLLGRIVEKKSQVAANGTIRFGNNFRAGVYFVEVAQDANIKTIKLIKE